jgi:hypothetical protein
MLEKNPPVAVEQAYVTLRDKITLLISRKSVNAFPIFVERMTSGQKRRAYFVKIKFIAKKILRK